MTSLNIAPQHRDCIGIDTALLKRAPQLLTRVRLLQGAYKVASSRLLEPETAKPRERWSQPRDQIATWTLVQRSLIPFGLDQTPRTAHDGLLNTTRKY